jgi:hypothetical protein
MVRLAVVVVALLLMIGGTFGCSQSSILSSPTPSVPVTLSPSTTLTAKPLAKFCTVELPTTWKNLFADGKVDLPDADQFAALTTAADGSRIFGELYSSGWSGVVAVSPLGSITQISAFQDPTSDQIIGASFDGRWLVWSEGHSLSDSNDWSILAWDSSAGEVITIATAPRVNGRTVSGPFVLPVVSDGNAAWVQANQSGHGEVHLYSLNDRLDQVLSAGKAGPPVAFWGSNLLWQELDVPGQSGHLAMADAATGKSLDVPEPLASIRHLGSSLVATTNLVAWDDGRSLWIWRPSDLAASQIFVADTGDHVNFVAIADTLVTWGGVKTQWAADLRSGSVTQITQQYGGRVTNDSTLIVSQPTGALKDGSGQMVPPSETDIVNATQLPPLAACTS